MKLTITTILVLILTTNLFTNKTEFSLTKAASLIYVDAAPLYKIEKIEFKTSRCMGPCPVIELEINADRTANYNAILFNDKEGKFKTTIDAKNYNAIINLLNENDFPNLEDGYQVKGFDYPTYILIITFDNGKIKEINEYGGMGTKGLEKIYNKLLELRENQSWKKS